MLNFDNIAFRSRAFGSAALNMVYTAQGSIDAYVEYGLHSWDMAAAAIILKEAGDYLMVIWLFNGYCYRGISDGSKWFDF